MVRLRSSRIGIATERMQAARSFLPGFTLQAAMIRRLPRVYAEIRINIKNAL
jgi:hypothetical protein